MLKGQSVFIVRELFESCHLLAATELRIPQDIMSSNHADVSADVCDGGRL